MKKITEDELMLILDELISYCEGKDKKSMMNEYSLIKKDLEGKKISPDESERLCRYFCGYQAYADLADYEYIRVKKMINFFCN